MLSRRSFLGAVAAVRPDPAAPSAAQLGASTGCLAGVPLIEAVRQIRALGFQALEITAYRGASHSLGEIPGFAHHRVGEKERRAVFDATRVFSRISAHLPFHDLHPFSFNEDVREFAVALLKKSIDGLAFLKGELAVVHVGGPGPGLKYRDIWKPMVDTFRGLGDHAGRRGVRIGIETMQPASFRDYTELIQEINHPHVGATIDTGHVRGCTEVGVPADRRDTDEARARFNDMLLKIVETLGDKVLHFHLSDVRRSDWRDHQAVGSGLVDFARLVAALRKRRFGGLMAFELEEPDKVGALKASRAHMERLLSG